jgi:DNA (cytosine-5)-methyltransferase 1
VRAYYNEIATYAAQWLRNLIAAGHIADGDVDTRSISDVNPGDLDGYTQCHFFAGLGGWSRALRLAGWPDNRPVWTGSCPCQPFSAAGRIAGFADERHLWPHWFHHIESRRPQTIFGEQVASKHALAWLDLVFSDLEGTGYTTWAADLCAAGVGAPHIRQRLWFVADRLGAGLEIEREQSAWGQRATAERSGAAGELGESDCAGSFEGNESAASNRQGHSTIATSVS